MDYVTPFHSVDDHHENSNPLCLSLENQPDPDESTWISFFEAAVELLSSDHEQPAFFVARHFVELSLKRLKPGWGHDLHRLLARLDPTEPLVSATTGDDYHLRCFIEDLGRVDPSSEAGRYGTTNVGPAFVSHCCVERQQVAHYLKLLFEYVANRDAQTRC